MEKFNETRERKFKSSPDIHTLPNSKDILLQKRPHQFLAATRSSTRALVVLSVRGQN